jgi:DNA-binding winged helix-turn-helix (wHTH) protein/tetratricopeptide (TPR) repeat protein
MLSFGPFRLDAARRVLWREGEVVPLTPKAVDVLAALLQRPGQVVTKDELMRQVWPETFVEEANLTVHVSALRKELRRTAGGKADIETLPRRGYRFVGEEPRTAPTALRSLAVLPFTSLEAAADDPLPVGMADALITRLGRSGQVLVRPTSAVLRYAGAKSDAVASGKELGVDAVLEGTLQRAGGRVRASARLLSVAEGTTLWADTFEEATDDLFRLQDALAARLAQALAVELGSTRGRGGPRVHPEAYRDHLRGRYFWNKLTGPWLRKARAAFQAAVDRDPAFAPAWSGLADTDMMLALFGLRPAEEALGQARQAAARAVELDADLAEAHVSLGYARLLRDWDWTGAGSELRRALELSPASAEAHQWHGLFLAMSGRFPEAMGEIERAQELDPLSLTVNTNAGFQLYLRQQLQPEVAPHQRTLELDPDYAAAHWALALAHAQQGRYDEAIAEHQRALELFGGGLLMKALLARTYALAGRRAEAEGVLRELERAPAQEVSPYHLALVHAALGDHERAFASLEEAARRRDHWLVWLQVDPPLEPLRSDPRFDALVRRVSG